MACLILGMNLPNYNKTYKDQMLQQLHFHFWLRRKVKQPVYQSPLHQLAAQFQFADGSNNVVGYIPTTDHAIETLSVNLLIGENPTINEVMPEPYDKEERSIPAYNPHNDYGLDDFDEDYIGHGGSREGVNDETSHYNGMESDPLKVVIAGLFHRYSVVQIEIHVKMMPLMLAIGPELQSPNLG
ncbi:hypothetical protein LWI28_005516 [Acer negundo]|uniref:Uncharacterized protein n=1 Tax=Acer negundo TaxID=4023 RepID=A0AAD5IC68_ACENE|nr:hypothetical protein LWI28_005516 [Acer negundo]